MNRILLTCLLYVTILTFGCGKTREPGLGISTGSIDPQIELLKGLISRAHYDQAAKKAKEFVAQNSTSPNLAEALYLESYALIFGERAYPEARTVLKQLLDYFPQSPHAVEAQQWVGDCHYWESNYDRALKEYHRLEGAGKGSDPYALYQEGNCLLLKDKVGDALAEYRTLVEKYPASPLAESAQLIVANTYLKLQDKAMAKTELQKFISITKNPDLLHSAQKSIQDLGLGKSAPPSAGVSN